MVNICMECIKLNKGVFENGDEIVEKEECNKCYNKELTPAQEDHMIESGMEGMRK